MSLRQPARSAFTLIEAAVSTVIVAVMIVAALQAVGSSAEARRRSIAIREADDLLSLVFAEIASVHFEDPIVKGVWGPETGETEFPRTFNDLDDYDGLNCSPPTDRDGTMVDSFADWKYTVTVTPVTPTTSGYDGDTADASSHLRLVEINVISQSGVSKTGRMLFSRQGARAFDPDRVAPPQTGVELRFQTAPGRTYIISSPLLNTPEAP